VVLVVGLALAVSGCGTLYGWGGNGFGQLGDGTTTLRSDPVPAARNPDWVQAEAGFYHSCGIDVHGALYCWGNNTRGELGVDIPGFHTSVPTRVGTATGWTDVSAAGASGSQGFTCGIRSGSLFCWGWNQDGQLGVGDTAPRSTPTQVGTTTDWTRVSAGHFHGCAIRAAGALFCWGTNFDGQVGDGTNVQRLTPVQVGTATDWTAVASGGAHTCGLRTGGRLFCWGLGGTVGDGTLEDRNMPVPVGPATGWTAVGLGGAHTCAIRVGTLSCWGENLAGQLGNGTFSEGDPTPMQVGTAADWTDVAGGAGSSCGIRANNLLFCWGVGPSGDGTTTTYAVPTQAQFDKWSSISLGNSHKLGVRILR
jgi:alpha-tubulin suppressor-like RCC1 family protein